MLTRIITSIVALLILVPFIIFSQTLVFPLGMALCAVLSVWEALHCVGLHKKFYLLIPYGLVAIAAPVSMRLLGGDTTLKLAVAVILLLMLYTYAVCVFARGKLDISSVFTGFMTTLYSIAGFTAMVYLHDFHEGGRFLFLLPFIGAWVTDIFAYFCGFFFGKHKLIPEISPKKTVEGSIGGILFCVLAFIGFTYCYNMRFWGLLAEGSAALPYWLMAIVGFVVSIVSQIGDLSMSALKRHYGIKDFGKIFPGHGGMLDRFDSVVAVSIVLACAFGMLL